MDSLGPLVERADAALRTAVLAEHRRVYGAHEEPATSGQRGHRAEIARWIVLRLERSKSLDEIESLAARLVRNFYARSDGFIRSQAHNLRFLAENPPKYLSEQTSGRARRGSTAALPAGTGEGFEDGGLEYDREQGRIRHPGPRLARAPAPDNDDDAIATEAG